MKVARACALVAVLLTAFAAAASAEPNYVALGDSYTSGPVIPLYEQPYGCLKSTNNYPHLAASRVGLTLRDASCAGAETEDMTAPQGVTPGPNPPQFDRLDGDTRLVTLQIGGNDIGFSSLAQDCFNTNPSAGSPCKDKYTAGGTDQVSARIADTGPKVAAVLAGIKAKSPLAKILVVNYSAIFPHTGGGCWPVLPVADGDVPWLRSKQEELNGMLAAQAAAAGAKLVDVYAASAGHDACQLPVIRWTEPLIPIGPAAPVHPNLIGMIAMADLVVAAANAP
jgi:lysophospholipase L1-like esterase